MAIPYLLIRSGSSIPSEDEIVEILRSPDIAKVSALPAVKPVENTCFIFRTDGGPRWYWRCDQYSWINNGRKRLKGAGMYKTYYKAKTTEFPNGDERFSKYEYSLSDADAIEEFVFVCYKGDSRIGVTQVHGNSTTNRRPFVRNAPIVKQKVLSGSTASVAPKKVYDAVTSEPAPSRLEAVVKPRSTEQVRNFLKAEKRKHRLTHDALYNTYELFHQLPGFMRYIRIAPHLNVRIISDEMMKHFEEAVSGASESEPIQVFIDTTFNLGDFYVTAILFRHPAFNGDPVVPLGFLFHEKKLQEDHRDFLLSFYKCSKEFQRNPKRVVFVSDREFDFTDLFPETKHVHCWIHVLDNVKRWLEKHFVSTKDQKDKYCADVKELMQQKTKREFREKYKEMKNAWDKSFRGYFKKHLKRVIKERVGRWVLEELQLYHPYSGITTNAVESFNAVIKRWQEWKEMPLDCSILALRRLIDYYGREIERGFYQLGDYKLKESVLAHGSPDQCPKRDVIHVQQIYDVVRGEVDKPKIVGEDDPDVPAEKKSNSVEALAREAVATKKVTFVPEQSCFIINGEEGIFTVQLSSPEICSCNDRNCYHISAARLTIGKSLFRGERKKRLVNLTLRHRNRRNKYGNTREGRKRPSRYATVKREFIPAKNSISARSFSQDTSAVSNISEFPASLNSTCIGETPRKKRSRSKSDVTEMGKRRRLSTVKEENDCAPVKTPVIPNEKESANAFVENNLGDVSDNNREAEEENVNDKDPGEDDLCPARSSTPMCSTAEYADSEESLMTKVQSLLELQFLGFPGIPYINPSGEALEWLAPFVQVLKLPEGRWVCLHFDGVSTVKVYSSFVIFFSPTKDEYVFSDNAKFIQLYCASLLGNVDHFSLVGYSKNAGSPAESSLLSVAFAVGICLGENPASYLYAVGNELKGHFHQCCQNGKFTLFPKTSKKKWLHQAGRDVLLYCHCRRPCIGPEFAKMIECTSCKKWFHSVCIDAPAEAWDNASFLWQCSHCVEKGKEEENAIALPPWGGTLELRKKRVQLSNTCTIDNFLAILQYTNAKSNFSLEHRLSGCSDEPFCTIGRILKLMKKGKFPEAKYEWAKALGIDARGKLGVVNFYGNLDEFWLRLFNPVFKFTSACSNSKCDLGVTQHTAGFCFDRFVGEEDNLRVLLGKYIAEYTLTCCNTPRSVGSSCDLTQHCEGKRTFSMKEFINSSPFLNIPVSQISVTAAQLPQSLDILGRSYRLIGGVCHKPGHFVGVLINNREFHYYDGVMQAKPCGQQCTELRIVCAVYLEC